MSVEVSKRSTADVELSDSTCTPKWLTDLLPHRDLDPCSNERAQPIADQRYHLPEYDGLALPWCGTAFVNWPFSAPLRFAQKAQHELREGRCTDLIVLCKLDCSTKWWREIRRPVPGFVLDLWMPEQRIQYDEHPELVERRRLARIANAAAAGKPTDGITGDSTANFVSVLFHHRKLETEPWAPFATFAERWTKGNL